MPRMKSLKQIESQIAALQQQAEKLKRQEAGGVIARIREAIAHYGLTAADLGLDSSKGVKRRVSANAPKAPKAPKTPKAPRASRKPKGAIKYRDEAGNSWSGHGRRPQWFLDALAAGKTEQDLRA